MTDGYDTVIEGGKKERRDEKRGNEYTHIYLYTDYDHYFYVSFFPPSFCVRWSPLSLGINEKGREDSLHHTFLGIRRDVVKRVRPHMHWHKVRVFGFFSSSSPIRKDKEVISSRRSSTKFARVLSHLIEEGNSVTVMCLLFQTEEREK